MFGKVDLSQLNFGAGQFLQGRIVGQIERSYLVVVTVQMNQLLILGQIESGQSVAVAE